jgi:hypothetical protein
VGVCSFSGVAPGEDYRCLVESVKSIQARCRTGNLRGSKGLGKVCGNF